MNTNTHLKKCRLWIELFIAALVLSGLTAIPLVWELDLLAKILGIPEAGSPHAADSWIGRVRDAVAKRDGEALVRMCGEAVAERLLS